MSYLNYQKETSWKLIYTEFNGITKRAIELLSAEMGETVTRANEIYSLYVLVLEKESENTKIGINAVIV